MEKCGANGKDCFPTKDLAKAYIGARGHGMGVRKVYRCPYGEHWHTTKGNRGPNRSGKKSR